jgi:hypothetical protein
MLSAVLLATACDKKTVETTTENIPADTIKKEEPVTPVPEPEAELTGKAKMIAKSWKAKELETPTAKLSDEFIDIKFDFKKDGSFEYSEEREKEKGTWKINDKETILTLKYENNMEVKLDIKELSETKMVIAGEEHGMYRSYTLVPKK